MIFKFVGWKKEGTSDKVWGVIQLDGPKCLTFWGRRGKKLQTKETSNGWDLLKLIATKENEGYRRIDVVKLHTVYPEFQTDLEKTTMWAMLKL